MNHRILFKQGRISRQQYYGEIEQVEQEIIQEMEKLKDKMMDSMDDTLLDGGLKMIDIKVEDINLLRDWFARSRSYQRSFDEDYISVKGDLEAAM